MTGIRLDLADPKKYRDYVQEHLAPVATELHRITNELLSPGATSAEEWAVDMVPSTPSSDEFKRLDKPIKPAPKLVVFDGAQYFTLPKELLRAKQVKVQMVAVVYRTTFKSNTDPVAFRLVRDDGAVIDNSEFQVSTREPESVSRILPFGEPDNCIQPARREYYIEARCVGRLSQPVCRRISLSFVYI